ncbi:low molecular weight protein-tyrosine-phosphatase [Candidatus Albibeggiatoa sp. nov. NOAA]|uniref:low molecular weight protein-tyrosine-phosphatase n=1 Tax=Candidatus Albibeggiatoa sp. nov. NOAA TaxID=3162724 RepID=UPI0032FC8348|nr:low molecular weight phosphotyrosine protein phosphatase [Thiotrichaceae bacterium]
MVKVLFVCMGNICRSPTAEGVFHHLVQQANLQDKIDIDSAGTHAYHIGEPPDLRSQQAAMQRGIDMSHLRARRVAKDDFEKFDYILAMDRNNYAILQQVCPKGKEHKLSMFLDFAPDLNVKEVPDPYYGGSKGFEHVLDLVEAASRGLLDDIRQQHLNA